ncbi:MAG: DUF4387 domain-containing protein [Phenylobacterium sp.]
MPRLREVCRHVRSKVAGPFWVTIDLFFDGEDSFRRYHASPAIGRDAIAAIYGADPALVGIYPVPSLSMVKVSYPRAAAQGGTVERDLHSGQQYVDLLDIEMT